MNQKLKNFIELNKNLAVQGSTQWLNERKHIIGGSEISVITGENRFTTLESLIAQKIGLTHFNGNKATRWGNLFEDVTELMFKSIFLPDGTIYNTGSIQHKDIINHKYSPDGLCIVKYLENGKCVKKITLLEFKSPMSTVPNGKVPKYYLPQVKAGMCTIDIVDRSIFVNNMYRKCSLKHLDFSIKYNNFSDTAIKLKNIEDTIANGIILFYLPEENLDKFNELFKEFERQKREDAELLSQYEEIEPEFNSLALYFENMNECDMKNYDTDSIDECDKDVKSDSILRNIKSVIKSFNHDLNKSNLNKDYKKLIDLGKIDEELFEEFLTLYKPDKDSSIFSVKYIKPQLNRKVFEEKLNLKTLNLKISDELKYVKEAKYLNTIIKKYNYKNTINNFMNKCEKTNNIPIAVLPWKLFKSDIIIVEKEENYLNDLKDKIDNTVNIIKEILKEENIEEKFIEIFPNSSVISSINLHRPLSVDYVKNLLM
jgi:hypothetical protein